MMGNSDDMSAEKPASRWIIAGCEGGFTLLELITSLVLLGLLAAVFGLGIVDAVKSNAFSRANVQLAQKGQLAMTRISREIRELTTIEAISGVSDETYIIYHRLPADTTQPAQRYEIHFYPNDQTLRIQGDILVDKVRGFSLNYYSGSGAYQDSGNWSWGNDPLLLSTIKVALQLERPDDPSATQDFETVVHLRNSENYGGAAYTTNPPTRNDYSCFISTMGRDLPFFQ